MTKCYLKIFINFFEKENKLFWKLLYKIINEDAKQFAETFKNDLWRIEIRIKERNFIILIYMGSDLKSRNWY